MFGIIDLNPLKSLVEDLKDELLQFGVLVHSESIGMGKDRHPSSLANEAQSLFRCKPEFVHISWGPLFQKPIESFLEVFDDLLFQQHIGKMRSPNLPSSRGLQHFFVGHFDS